jgi:hypothetical protein
MMESSELYCAGSEPLANEIDGESIWGGSVMACLYFDRKINYSNAYTDFPCRVTFRPGELEIAYRNDGPLRDGQRPDVVYRGKENGPGHYYLWNGRNGSGKGNARMHLTKSNVLEGSWEEDGLRGMWMVTLRRG